MVINLSDLYIDEEFEKLLPKPTEEELDGLKQSILQYGLLDTIKLWQDPETGRYIIIDGHNRYKIIKKYNLPWDQWNDYKFMYELETKDDVKRWMLQQQLGRRNLPVIQRIMIAEKYRTLFEKEAKENQGTRNDLKNNIPQNLGESEKKKISKAREVNSKLAKVANVNSETYRQAKRILNSNNEDIKQRVLSSKISINAGYKELTQNKNEEKRKPDKEVVNASSVSKPQNSEDIKQKCTDLKTEKTKEYLDSIWNYKIDIIECMNVDFKSFFTAFASALSSMEGRVTHSEKKECIRNAENMVNQMLKTIEEAKKLNEKIED